jgi:hypothetical protein
MAPTWRAANYGVDRAAAWSIGVSPPAAILSLLLGATAAGSVFAAGEPDIPARADPRLSEVAREARQTIAVIDWFYVRHRACPQPSRPAELEALQDGLGDGFSVDLEGRFVTIRGISMISAWLYYTASTHPDKCTLWRKLGWDPALIWRRDRSGGRWWFDPGDGSGERLLKVKQ